MSELQFIEKEYREADRLKNETLFHTASGRLGIRGCFEEGAPKGTPSVRGAYLNGFCETLPVSYNEKLCGFPEEKQQLVNLPDAQTIRLCVGGEPLFCWNASDYSRVLDMKSGVCERSFTAKTPSGRLRVSFTRLVSFPLRDIFAVECRISSLGFSGSVAVESELEPDVRNFTDAGDPRVASGSGQMLRTVRRGCDNGFLSAEVETLRSKRRLLCAVMHDMDGAYADTENAPLRFSSKFCLHDGQTVTFHKYSIYRELLADGDADAAYDALKVCRDGGFEALCSMQRSFLDDFWANARVTVSDDPALQTQLDLCLYGMLCSAGSDGKSSVAAKGLSGEGYEGHYFWDSEIYVFPFFLYSVPQTARALLEYRFRHLNDARAHARRMGHSAGALYPWRTITGSECSSHYPTGSAQYHINGDIARAFTTYFDVTGDTGFLPQTCEVLIETARLWLDAGHWLNGEFRIDCVTGPDEYTCMVNNNYYTNACAAANLAAAARLCGELQKLGGLEAVAKRVGLASGELDSFRSAAEAMYFPYSADGTIIAQDDSFLSKKRWDFKALPAEQFPLLMHYHPLLLSRAQVLKQADSVLANALYREESPLRMRRSYEYYEQITTHDSSLSNCIYAIMAARLGDLERAWQYFSHSLGTDTDDQNGNTKDGLHIANMGGVYAVMTAGFGGVRSSENGLSIFPLLPKKLSGYSFMVCCRGSRLKVCVNEKGCTLRVTEGESTCVTVYGQSILVGKEAVTVLRRAEAVIFDLDGVITNTASLHYLAWKRLSDELNIPFSEKQNEAFKGVSRAQCLRLLLGWGGKTVTDEQFGALLTRKNDYYCELLESLSPADILPGVSDCLARLRLCGIPYALFSVSKNTDRILERIGLSDAFSHRVTGFDIAFSKPHYEGYLLAAQKLGVDPRLCVMVEDSEAGIQGAKALSMLTLMVAEENRADADLCVQQTGAVTDALSALLLRKL